MKKVYKGWVGKDRKLSEILQLRGVIYPHLDFDEIVYKNKGPKSAWSEDNWPPVRVTITVEIEERQ